MFVRVKSYNLIIKQPLEMNFLYMFSLDDNASYSVWHYFEFNMMEDPIRRIFMHYYNKILFIKKI